MRYFVSLAYNGTRFEGWQEQPSGNSVQQRVAQALSTVLRSPIAVVGCGRTDTGVHAAQYMLHFDAATTLPNNLLLRLNHLAGKDIVLHQIWAMQPEAHARFDAVSRSYYYRISTVRDPFSQETAWFLAQAAHIDRTKMQAAAQLLLEYHEFAPFCKAHGQAQTMRCTLSRAEWVFDDTAHTWTFHISANRFLRGMIRLIVGACIYIGLGKMSIEDLRQALHTQTSLPKPYSVPPQGLFLHDIRYPSAIFGAPITFL